MENRLFGGVFRSGDEGADQAIGFSRVWRCPPERMEQVVVNDGAIELGFLKVRERVVRCRGTAAEHSGRDIDCLHLYFYFRWRVRQQDKEQQDDPTTDTDTDEYTRFSGIPRQNVCPR
ncbi:MAG: hypothetical protein OXG97_04395 [Candidatus Poribacteria bacterium]|nr:hypothetical protein [Candidatus Poribacteria bacterium]